MPTTSDTLRLYPGRSRRANLGVIAVGLLLAFAVYLWLAFRAGGVAYLTSDESYARLTRQSAAAIAGIVAGCYYSGCSAVRVGGPVPNVVAVGVAAVVAPVAIGLAVGSAATPAISYAWSGLPLGALYAVYPGLLTFFVLLGLQDVGSDALDRLLSSGGASDRTADAGANRSRDEQSDAVDPTETTGAATGEQPSAARVRAVSALLFLVVPLSTVLSFPLSSVLGIPFMFTPFFTIFCIGGSVIVWRWGTKRYARSETGGAPRQ